MTEYKELQSDTNDTRIDRFIRRHCGDILQSILERGCREKKILINDRVCKKTRERVHSGDLVRIHLSLLQKAQKPMKRDTMADKPLTRDEKMLLEAAVIFEDDDMIVLNKPFGIAVQGGTNTKIHLDGLLNRWRPQQKFYLVHRLDKHTSGVLLVAKTPQEATRLSGLFKTHTLQKHYLAVVHRRLTPSFGTIEAPMKKDFKNQKEQMIIDPQGLLAITHYETVDVYKNYSCVLLMPVTGRTHQLRVHLQHIGHPIVGDGKYALDDFDNQRYDMHLHAFQITLPYGPKERMTTFKADIPTSGLYPFFHLDDL